jgi:hypothetical protein
MSSKDDYLTTLKATTITAGWFIQFKSHCRGIVAHMALKARPTHPVDVNGNPLVLNQAQARALAKLQATWDEHDDKITQFHIYPLFTKKFSVRGERSSRREKQREK